MIMIYNVFAALVKMSRLAFNTPKSCNGIVPDMSLLFDDNLTTDATIDRCTDVEPRLYESLLLTTTHGDAMLRDPQVDNKNLLPCALCRTLSRCDKKLHQKPAVRLKQLDMTDKHDFKPDDLIPKPDVNVYCDNNNSTINAAIAAAVQCSDVKPDPCGNLLTTDTRGDMMLLDNQMDDKPHTCNICQCISCCDGRLHQDPVVRIELLGIISFPDCNPDYDKRNPWSTMSNSLDLLPQPLTRVVTEKPYICIDCGRGHCSLNKWKIHTMLHAGVKPYLCILCYQQFSTRKRLLRHITIDCPPTPPPRCVFVLWN